MTPIYDTNKHYYPVNKETQFSQQGKDDKYQMTEVEKLAGYMSSDGCRPRIRGGCVLWEISAMRGWKALLMAWLDYIYVMAVPVR